MTKLIVTFRDHRRAEFEGPEEEVAALEARIREAMSGSMDTVISHDFDVEPKDFLCSDVAQIHTEE